MTFEEIIEAGRHAESLDEVGGLWDELLAVSGQTREGFNARTSELEEKIAELENEMTRLMAENYKLMTAAAAGDEAEAEDEAEDEDEEETEDEEEGTETSIEDYIED